MILYINGNYPHHSLHSELVFKLAEMDNEITVFIPMSGTEYDGKYVTIEFDVGEKFFQVPQAFDEGYLESEYPGFAVSYCMCMQRKHAVPYPEGIQ